MYVTVLWQGRAVQSLALTGSVLAPGSPVSLEVMKFSVDVLVGSNDRPATAGC